MYSFENARIYSSIELEISDSAEVFKKLLNNLNESLANIKLKHKAEVAEDDCSEHALLQLEELVINELEKQQYYAYCLAVHSSFEGKLRKIISKIETEPKFNFKIKFNDIKGDSDLNKFYKYFSKVFGMDVTKIKDYYDFMCNQKEIRNKIAHHNGIITTVEKDKKSMQKIKHLGFEMIEEFEPIEEFEAIEERSVLEKKPLFQIKLNNDYLLVLNENISSFYKELIPAIDERYKTLKQN